MGGLEVGEGSPYKCDALHELRRYVGESLRTRLLIGPRQQYLVSKGLRKASRDVARRY
jgi:hypothetical protein